MSLLLKTLFYCSVLALLQGCSLWSIDEDVSPSPKESWQANENALPKENLLNGQAKRWKGKALKSQPSEPLSLYALFELALGHSPQTRYAWEQAKIAAGDYGVQKTAYLPTGSLSAGLINSHYETVSPSMKGHESLSGAAVDMTWLLFNFGGREAELSAFKQALYAANFNFNQSLQDVALAVQNGYLT